MADDVKTPTRDETTARPVATRQARTGRVLASIGALVLVLGAGWIAGIKTHKTIDVAQISSTAWTRAAAIGADLGTSGTRMLASVQNKLASWTTTPQERSSTLAIESATTAGAEGDMERITFKIDQVRASSEAAVEGLRGTIDRVVSTMESNQRQLVTKLEDLGGRLDHVEQNGPVAGPVLTKLEQLNERLDRIEHSAAVALTLTQASALASSTTSAAKSTKEPVQASAPTPVAKSSEELQAPVGTKKIPAWIVHEVKNGKATLQGPKGVISVSAGDLVPGIGRVQSITRQGNRWIVATKKGVISTR